MSGKIAISVSGLAAVIVLMAVPSCSPVGHEAEPEAHGDSASEGLSEGGLEFNSMLALEVFVYSETEGAFDSIGSTPAEKPLSIPKCRCWTVHPLGEVSVASIREEAKVKPIRGIRLLYPSDEDLAQLSKWPELRTLDLWTSHMTDARMACLKDMKELQRLWISGPEITDNPPPAPVYELIVANALWGQKGYAFKPAFTQLVQKNYGAGLNQVDFGQAEAARKTINDWVAQQTKDKIKDLIPKGVINDLTRLAVTNAIYFKSKWAKEFSKEVTKDGLFKLTADKSVDVPMMHHQEHFSYMENDDLQMLDLPYIQYALSMVIILPRKVDGLADVEKSLTAANIAKWRKDGEAALVKVTLPRFKFSSDFLLPDTLKGLGMTDAFDQKKADFSGMTSSEKLFLSAVIHKAFLAVDEEGTEAAAATGGVFEGAEGIGPPPKPKVFKADHPFIFLIRHNATGEILFMGRVMNPKGE